MTPDDQHDFSIFKPGPASFEHIIESFKAFSELAAPLTETLIYRGPREPSAGETISGGIRFFIIPVYKDKDHTVLPAFTDARLLKPPFTSKPPLELLKLYFCSQTADFFSFNPSLNSAVAAGPEIRLNRQQLSLVIGALETSACPGASSDNSSDPARQAEMFLGQAQAHKAHYLASLAPAGPQTTLIKAAALMELDLYQDAYDLLTGDESPQALCLLAEIHRRTDNPRKARELLFSIPQSAGLDRRKNLETAWLDLDEGKTVKAQRMFGNLAAAGGDERQEALFGLAMATAGPALAADNRGNRPATPRWNGSPAGAPKEGPRYPDTENTSGLSEATAAFEAALECPSKASSRIFFYAGNFFLRSGHAARAEVCLRESSRLSTSPQARANLILALLKGNKLEEAADLTTELALIESASAVRLAAQFPKDKAQRLFESAFRSLLEARPAAVTPWKAKGSPPPPPPANTSPAPIRGTTGETIISLEAAVPKAVLSSRSLASSSPEPVTTAPAPADGARQPASRRTYSGDTAAEAAQLGQESAPALKLETNKDILSAALTAEEETKKDSFLSRAFELASGLEDEFGKKIHFNIDCLTDIERKLRLTFIRSKGNSQEKLDTVRDCAAFLCYVLQERLKGQLIKFQDFDPWGWPMIFERPSYKITSYPIERVWKLLWQDTLPDPGWLTKYLHYLEEELNAAPGSKMQGMAAVRSRVMSHAEKITEAQTEHKRMRILASSLVETSDIETGRTGLAKMEQVLKTDFHPNIPPTSDGWKLLRCYGHLLAGTMIKDFKASWYNVEGSDGLWSMQTPWKTFIFPIGKIYKEASSSSRDGLAAYYDHLVAEKLKYATGQ
ncbi:MAG TPA: hypothetical protein DCL44_10130 [Elusimicrobia bacterium]|nr:hypothetical protein [Elusimicrobiota bacterium]